jgi:hypothetical protein
MNAGIGLVGVVVAELAFDVVEKPQRTQRHSVGLRI